MGADVNLTRHLTRLVTWKHVADIELYDTMGAKQKFAYCKGSTRQCTLLEKPVDSPPRFWSRLKQKNYSILLTGIQENDDDLEIIVKIHSPRSIHTTFTLRIRLDTPQGSPQGKFLLEFNMKLSFTSNISPSSI